MNPSPSLRPPLLRVLLGTCCLLLIPAVAMQLTGEVQWGPGDFLAAGGLLFVTGSAMVLTARAVRHRWLRAGIIGLLALALLTVWAELAVGILH